MAATSQSLERSVHRFALALALFVALCIPLGYWLVAYDSLTTALAFKARVKATALSGAIASNPDTWMFAENRLQGLIAHEPVPLQDELVQVLDVAGAIITTAGSMPADPLLKHAYPLYDTGRVVGQLTLTVSLQSLIWKMLASALLGLLLSTFVYLVMKVLPLRALNKATEELRDYQAQLERRVEERTRELTLAKEAAEAASHSKTRFLSNMSHELRTPMNAVIGMLALARKRMSDPKGLDQIDKAKAGADHLLAVINDILDISKIEAEHVTPELIEFKLGEVLDRLGIIVGHKAEEKGLTLLIEPVPSVASCRFVGDPLRLGQILLNLAGNAVKFTEHGTVSVHVRQLEDGPAAMRLRFEVRDSGIGISTTDQVRLFTAFEQADNSMTRKYGGTGLGLAISKRLVQMMDGEIGVDSVPGQGSTFWFTVRLAKAADHAVPPAPAFTADTVEEKLLAQFSGTRVLLAEDEPINQEVACCLLTDVGLQVDTVEDGATALQLAQQQSYALILMDVQMPVLNGIDATRSIRSASRNTATPILAMTANAFEEDRQICLAAGMNDHIAKPIDPQLLYETLLKWLESSRQS